MVLLLLYYFHMNKSYETNFPSVLSFVDPDLKCVVMSAKHLGDLQMIYALQSWGNRKVKWNIESFTVSLVVCLPWNVPRSGLCCHRNILVKLLEVKLAQDTLRISSVFSHASNYGTRKYNRGWSEATVTLGFLVLIHTSYRDSPAVSSGLPSQTLFSTLRLPADFIRENASAFLTFTSSPDWFFHASLYPGIVSIDSLFSASAARKNMARVKW